MQKSFDQMNLHLYQGGACYGPDDGSNLHDAISDPTEVTGLAITDAILDGEHDPARLADLARGKIRANRLTLIKALEVIGVPSICSRSARHGRPMATTNS